MTESSSSVGEQTRQVADCLGRLREGDTSVRGELLNLTQGRLLALTGKMKRDFRGVGRWEQTEDVFQNAAMRFYQALADAKVENVRHFYRLAALQIRRELIDLARRHRGPQGFAKNHATAMSPGDEDAKELVAHAVDGESGLDAWSDFHECVERLDDREREVVELLWYHELPQDEAAELLEVSTRTIKRIWRSARLALFEMLQPSHGESIVL